MKSISYKYKNGQLYRADTLKIVSEHIRHSIKSIVKNVYLNDRFFSYRSVKIPKKNGEYRILNPVIGPLKTIQKKTYNYFKSKR